MGGDFLRTAGLPNTPFIFPDRTSKTALCTTVAPLADIRTPVPLPSPTSAYRRLPWYCFLSARPSSYRRQRASPPATSSGRSSPEGFCRGGGGRRWLEEGCALVCFLSLHHSPYLRYLVFVGGAETSGRGVHRGAGGARTGIARRWCSEEAGGVAAPTMQLSPGDHWIKAVAGSGAGTIGNGMCASSVSFICSCACRPRLLVCRAHARSGINPFLAQVFCVVNGREFMDFETYFPSVFLVAPCFPSFVSLAFSVAKF